MSLISKLLTGVSFVVLPPILFVDMKSHSYLRHGKKIKINFSEWDSDIQEEEKNNIILKRQPILDAFHNLFELKLDDTSSVASFFSGDCIYEDPFSRIENKHELLKTFLLNRKLVKKVNLKKFEVFHSQNCFYIKCEKIVTNRNDQVSSLPSIVEVNLCKNGNEETVISVTDYWNNIAILSSSNYMYFGHLFPYYRRFNVKQALFVEASRTYMYEFVKNFLNI